MPRRYVIIGNGPAGATAAETVRRLDPTADIAVLASGVLFFAVAWLFSPSEAIRDVYVIPDGAAAKAGLVDGVTIESVTCNLVTLSSPISSRLIFAWPMTSRPIAMNPIATALRATAPTATAPMDCAPTASARIATGPKLPRTSSISFDFISLPPRS